jgi:hypothetical protein
MMKTDGITAEMNTFNDVAEPEQEPLQQRLMEFSGEFD